MANNKEVREEMIKKYGAECWMEDEGIRYLPDLLDIDRNGRSEQDNMLTYHHIIPQSKGGETTEENGAIIRGYNHKYLEALPVEQREEINMKLQEYKAYRDVLLAKQNLIDCEKRYEEIRKRRKEMQQNKRINKEEKER